MSARAEERAQICQVSRHATEGESGYPRVLSLKPRGFAQRLAPGLDLGGDALDLWVPDNPLIVSVAFVHPARVGTDQSILERS